MRHPVLEKDFAEFSHRNLPWDRLAGSTVVVSGAYGFINAYLIECLLFQNEIRPGFDLKVVGIGRNEEKAAKRFSHYARRSDFTFVAQDVCAPYRANHPVDFVIHGASWASPKYYGKDPVGVLRPNIFGTAALLDLAEAKKSRGFLFLSSAETYGNPPPDEIPIRESFLGSVNPVDVRSCYAESKRMGETMCVSWSHRCGLPVKIARVFHTYGPGMALDDGRVFADFVRDVVERRDISMNSDGSARRAFCYLLDAADGLLRILLQGESGVPYNMGNEDNECSMLELANLLAGMYPDRPLNVSRKAASNPAGYLQTTISRTVPDTTRLRHLGWKPSITLADGFRRTVDSYL